MTGKLPTRLTKQPIIDAIFEVRFSASVDASLLLPGLWVQSLGTTSRVEKLPLAEMPEAMRQKDDFIYQPVVRIFHDKYIYLIGSRSCSVGCQLPYPGWSNFKQKILDALNVLFDSGIVDKIQRYSLKYVDLLEFESQRESFDHLNILVDVAGIRVTDSPMNLSVHFPGDDHRHILNVTGPARIKLLDGVQKNGTVISVDTLSAAEPLSVSVFKESLADRIDLIHMINKKRFFNILNPKALDLLGAVYE